MKYTKAELGRIAKKCAAYLVEKAERDAFFYGRQDRDDLKNHPPTPIPLVDMLVEMKKLAVARVGGNPSDVKAVDLSFYDYAGFMSELDSAEREARTAWERVQRLLSHFEMGELVPFNNCSPEVGHAYEALMQGWLDIKRAKEIAVHDHPPATRAMVPQRSAVVLAHGYLGNTRGVQHLARQIMLEAGLEPPDASTVRKWLIAIKDEDRRSLEIYGANVK